MRRTLVLCCALLVSSLPSMSSAQVPELILGGPVTLARIPAELQQRAPTSTVAALRTHLTALGAHFTQVDHAFRSKAITGFGSWRSAVSADVDHRR